MNEDNIQKAPNVPAFVRFVASTIPMVFDDSMSYYEALANLVHYIQDTVNVVNHNATVTEEYIQLTKDMKEYMDQYFDNLDVQSQINIKLDKMAEDGTLASLMNEYVQPSINQLNEEIEAETASRVAGDAQLQSQITGLASGSPLVASSTAGMTDHTKIYVNTSDGHWYYWNGSAWTDGGTYQASESSFSVDYLEDEMHSIADGTELTYNFTWIDGYRLTTGQGTPYGEGTYSYCDYLPYLDAYKLNITGLTTTSQCIVCFYSADGSYLGFQKLSDDIRLRVIPENTAKFRFCIKTADKADIVASAKMFVNRRINALDDFINLLDTVNVFHQNINTNVSVGDTVTLTPSDATGYRYIITTATEGDEFVVNGRGGTNPRLWAFLDGSNKLLAKSGANISGEHTIKAPAKTAKLVCNFSYTDGDEWESYYLINISRPNLTSLNTGYNYASHNISGVGHNIRTNVGAGETVSLTPEDVAGWRYFIKNCSEGDKFIIKGQGGDNPRLWAFLDSSNKLITKSTGNLNGEHLITAPQNSAKLVCNFNNTESYYVTNADDNNIKTLGYKVDNIEYDPRLSYASVITPPANATSAFMRGVTLQHQLNNYLTDFKKPTDTMCHVGTFKIINDIVYVTYYASETATSEDPTKHIVRFVKASLNNLDTKTFYDIQKVGDTFDGHSVTAIYDTILMKVDNNNLAIMWTCQLDGVYTRLYKIYNITNDSFGDIEYNYFKVGNNSAIFNTTNMNTLLNNAGIAHKPISIDIGIMQKVTSRVENGVTTYYTGCYAGAFNCIIKSTNFITWEFVASPSFEDDSIFENACYLKDSKVYYFIRQSDNKNYGLLSYYDLTTNTWAEPVKVNDCQSRSDFIERLGELYLVHACQNRNQISIMWINRSNLVGSMEFNDACMIQSFYPYVDMYANEFYMIYTQARRHMYFAKFTFGANDNYLVEGLYNKLFA